MYATWIQPFLALKLALVAIEHLEAARAAAFADYERAQGRETLDAYRIADHLYVLARSDLDRFTITEKPRPAPKFPTAGSELNA